jgi:TonB family protein
MKKSTLALMAFIALAPAVALAQFQGVRVGGSVQAPDRIRYVAPVYPAVAQAARVSGIVILEAVVGVDGAPTDVRVLKSIDLLDEAAIEAVRQWRYTPTTLNGVPVPVIMTVTVNFALSANGIPGAPQNSGISAMSTGGMTQSEMPTEWNGKPIVRIGGVIKAPERTKYVAPGYPEIAQAANVTGIVIIEALVDEEGNVGTAKVVKSIPLLDQAALDAVMQWKYTPTLLNGAPVPVVMTVTVNFSIGGK